MDIDVVSAAASVESSDRGSAAASTPHEVLAEDEYAGMPPLVSQTEASNSELAAMMMDRKKFGALLGPAGAQTSTASLTDQQTPILQLGFLFYNDLFCDLIPFGSASTEAISKN
jgi:hypothetical protein